VSGPLKHGNSHGRAGRKAEITQRLNIIDVALINTIYLRRIVRIENADSSATGNPTTGRVQNPLDSHVESTSPVLFASRHRSYNVAVVFFVQSSQARSLRLQLRHNSSLHLTHPPRRNDYPYVYNLQLSFTGEPDLSHRSFLKRVSFAKRRVGDYDVVAAPGP